jgi:hypothetical protein
MKDNKNDTAKSAPSTVDANDESRAAPSSSSWWSRMSSTYQETIDDQRMERLAQCQVLAEILKSCRSQQTDRLELEDVPMGIRSVRYFQWRDYKTPAAAAKKAASSSTPPPPPSCLREEHALWACRAVALKCGSELVRLRDCFHEQASASAVLEPPSGGGAAMPLTAYDSSSAVVALPCGDFQSAMGDCVRRNAVALAERQRSGRHERDEMSSNA